MRLKEEQISKLAEKVLESLTGRHLIILKKERGTLISGIKEAIASNLRAEEALEKDAERLLEQTLRSTGGGVSIDRHKMLKMIKDKLAKERKFVL